MATTFERQTMEKQPSSPPQVDYQYVLDGKRVIIAGNRPMMTALVSFYLEREGNAKTTLCTSLDDAINTVDSLNDEADVILWDVHGLENNAIVGTLQRGQLHKKIKMALLDVSRESSIEKQALLAGVKGLFYFGDPLPLLLKGVYSICRGGIWAPRRILESILLDGFVDISSEKNDLSGLTSREVDVLRMVSEGSANSEIADKLHISEHTVKAHLHKVFKKISVSNRIQAARWASQNLPPLSESA